MTPERWRRAQALFHRALEQPLVGREAFLDAACGDDGGLRGVLRGLVEADARAAAFLDGPAWGPASEAEADLRVGQRLGPYRLVDLVGRGGMGAVYRAVRDDDEYRAQVAIKVMCRGLGDSGALQRFRAERQILAGLDHPHIARLLDGGTSEDGRPYVVMEYVEGQPIDQYCRERALTLAERLELFEKVCAAVSYAHGQLVVHRDLKPGNILVTSDGQPKLVDFGIAKLLDPLEGQAPTTVGLRPLTPDYASPEQVRGERVSTASDVYSLGVLLFELLTGQKPYVLRNASLEELLRVVCLEPPPAPSAVAAAPVPETTRRPAPTAALRRALRGDLDNIVLMALRKEPQRRYASVEHLAADLRRHREGRPVRARPDTLSYRAGKFVRRHRLAVAALGLAGLSLVAGAGATLHQARRAERRLQDVRGLASAFLFDFHDAVADLPGSLAARELVARRGLEYLDRLAQEAGDDPRLALELAVAYMRVGDVQGGPFGRAGLGDTASALRSYERGLGLLRDLSETPEGAVGLRRAALLNRLADLTRSARDLDASRRHWQDARRASRELLAREPGLAPARAELARSLDTESIATLRGGEIERARAAAREGLAELAGVVPGELPAAEFYELRGALQREEARALLRQGDVGGAIAAYQRARDTWERLVAAQPLRRSHRRHLAVVLDYLAEAAGRDARPDLALASAERAAALFRGLSEADPSDGGARRDLMLSLANRGHLLFERGRGAEAVTSGREAVALAEGLLAAEPESPGAQRGLLFARGLLAEVLTGLGRQAEALPLMEGVLGLAERLAAGDPASGRAQEDVAKAHLHLGLALAHLGRLRPALAHHERSVSVYEGMLARDPADRETRMLLGEALAHVGDDRARLAAAATPGPQAELCLGAGAARRRALGIYEALAAEGALEGSMLPEVERLRRLAPGCPATPSQAPSSHHG